MYQEQGLPIKADGNLIGKTQNRAALVNSNSVRRLRALVEAYNRFQSLAAAYVRAAQFFNSSALLAKGRVYIAPIFQASDIIHGRSRIAMASSTDPLPDLAGISPRDINTVRDLEMRYATTQARLTDSTINIATAASLIGKNADPVMHDAAEPLIGREAEFCDATGVSEALQQACSDENDLAGRLRSFWVNAAQIELLTGPTGSQAPRTPFDTFDVAMKAIAGAEPKYAVNTVRYTSTDDEMVMLLLARVDSIRSKSHRSVIGSTKNTDLANIALDDLIRAERLTPVALNPNRFRQIAERYLQIVDMLFDSSTVPRDVARYAVYLRTVLGGIESVGTGGVAAAGRGLVHSGDPAD